MEVHGIVLACALLLFPLLTDAQQPNSAPPVGGEKSTLPDAPSATAAQRKQPGRLYANQPFVPLTGKQKAVRWLHSSYSPYTFTSVLLNGTWAEIVNDWPSYGGGMEGYGKRLGATLANTESAAFFKVFLLPTLLHDDPRYSYSGKKGIVERGWYAATRVLVTRKDDGRNVFNSPEIFGTLFIAAATNAYYPQRDRGFTNTVSRAFGGLTSDAASNVLKEFWPDISHIFHKHEPQKVKNIEEKIPKSISGAEPGKPSE